MDKRTIITAFPTFRRLPAAFLLILVATFVVVPSAFADVIRGRVVDSETKEALSQATIKMTQKFGDNGYMTMTTTADSLGMFHIRAEGKCSIEASMLGYYTKKKTVLAFGDSEKDTLDIGTIELKMSPQMLKMVEVTGHARRFTVRGDTGVTPSSSILKLSTCRRVPALTNSSASCRAWRWTVRAGCRGTASPFV